MAVRVVFLFGAFLLLSLSSVGGKELIVNGHDSAASDDNEGSIDKPLKTISAAAARIRPGDKVMIHGGDYRETVIVTASGTTDAPIVFDAVPGETPVIKGSDLISNWIRDSGETWKAKLQAIPERKNDPKDLGFWRTNDVRQIFVKDGVFLDARALRRVTTRQQIQPGTFFCDVTSGFLFVWLSDSTNPNERQMEVSLRGAWLYVFGSNIVIRHIQMRHSSTLAIINWPACSLAGDDIALEDCTLSWSDFKGVNLGGNQNKLIRCTIACHGNSGINGNGNGPVIEKCRVIYNNVDRFDPSWHCGGAKLIPRLRHGSIRHNEFAHNIGPGLWLDDGCNDNLIESNLCHDNEGPGIIIETGAGNRVFNNISFNNRNPLSGEFLTPDPEAIKRGVHTVFISIRRGDEAMLQPRYHAGDGRGIYISSSPNSKVYHNTCILNEGEGICVEGGPRQTSAMEMMSTHDCEVLNNISAYNKGAQLVLRRDDRDTRDNRSDYNMLLALGSVFAHAGWEAPFASSLKEWQRQSDQDRHSIEIDPAFATVAMGDFRLLPISAGVRAGLPLEDVPRDFFDNARSGKSVSIGACEGPALDYPRPSLP